MTDLVLIRHGATAWNAEGRIQGHSDQPLSEAGRAQVRGWRLPPEIAAGAWHSLTSPLSRARETAALLTLDAEAEAALIEMSWGAWEGRRLADLRAENGAAMAASEARGLDFRPPGGESPRDVQVRLRPLLAQLAEANQPVVAVTHKGVIRALTAEACGWDMTGEAPERLRDDCAHRLRLDAAGDIRVSRLNIPLVP